MKKVIIDFEDFANLQYCSAWVATAIVGSAVIGAATTAYTSSKAADAQVGASERATAAQMSMADKSNKLLQDQYDTTRKDLEPYRTAGTQALTDLQARLPFLTTPPPMSQEQLDLQKPINFTQEELEKLPGYEFTKTQGLKATQNSAAARGLGVSGAALKGASAFATGLADQTYKNQFELESANRQNAFGRYQQVWQNQIQGQQSAYDRLMGLVTTGGNAAAQTSKIGADTANRQSIVNTETGKSIGGNMIGAGNAQAGAYTATGNAIGKAANDVGGYMAYRGLYGNKIGSGDPMSFTYGAAGDYAVPTFGGYKGG